MPPSVRTWVLSKSLAARVSSFVFAATLISALAVAWTSAQALRAFLLRAIGLPTHVGFVYSVYENRATRRQHIVYRCDAGFGDPFDRLGKSCYVAPAGAPAGGWTQCATEGGSCSAASGQPVDAALLSGP